MDIFYAVALKRRYIVMLLASAHTGIKTESYTEVYSLGLYKEY